MSVPDGTLTDTFRKRLLEFYRRMLDWREMETLRRPDLADEQDNVHLEPLSTNDDGEGSFRFRFLLPMAVEAQFYASLL